MERAKEILIRHFGGFTIQEARGGWMDDGKLCQEYTLVIDLSDTTAEKVHAAPPGAGDWEDRHTQRRRMEHAPFRSPAALGRVC